MAGLSSLSKNINIKGQPHSLAYINKAEAALLKARGGSGKPMKGTRGVPAYIDTGEGMGGYGSGAADDATGGMGDPGAGMSGAETDAAGTYGGYDEEDSLGGLGPLDFDGIDKAAAAAADAADRGALQDFYEMTPQTIDLMAHPAEDPEAEQNRYNRKKIPVHRLKKDTLGLLQDPVLLAAQTDPDLKKWYDDAIRGAAQSMSSNQVLGVMGQSGRRDGSGYISSLERGGVDRTWGLGIRGDYEVQAPEGMTKDQYNNYVDLYMAFDETRAGKLRMELDAVKKDSPETVGSIFEKAGVNPSIYGLDPKMNAYKVGDYMNMKALEGIVDGFPMMMSVATGSVSPMMLSKMFASEAIPDMVKEINRNVVGTPLEDPVKAAEDLSDELKENVMSVVPENIDIAARIGELFGIQNQAYFDKEGFYNRPEPTVESLMTEEDNANFDLNYNMTRDADGNPIAFINRDVTDSGEENQRILEEIYEQNRERPPPGYTQTPEQTEELMRMIGAN